MTRYVFRPLHTITRQVADTNIFCHPYHSRMFLFAVAVKGTKESGEPTQSDLSNLLQHQGRGIAITSEGIIDYSKSRLRFSITDCFDRKEFRSARGRVKICLSLLFSEQKTLFKVTTLRVRLCCPCALGSHF